MFIRARNWWRRIRLAWRLTGIFASLAVFYLIFGFLILPWGGRHLAESQLTQTLGRAVVIERVRFNPLTLELSVEGLRVMEQGESPALFASLGRLYLDLSSASVFRLAAVADTVRLETPFVHVVRTDPNVYNFTDILETLAGQSGVAADDESQTDEADGADTEPEGDVFPVVVRNFVVANGTAYFDDLPLAASHSVEQLNLNVPFTSGLEKDLETYVEPTLSLIVDGRPVQAEGRTLPFHDSLKTEFSIDINELNLAGYWGYVPFQTPARLASGVFSCDLLLSLERSGSVLPRLDVRGEASLENVSMVGPDQTPFAGFASLNVPLEEFSLLDRIVALGEVALVEPFVRLKRGGNGLLDIMAWLPGTVEEGGTDGRAGPDGAAAVAETSAEDGDEDATATNETVQTDETARAGGAGTQDPDEKTFLITASRVRVDRLSVDFADALEPEPFVGRYVIDAHADAVRSDLSAPVPFAVTIAGAETGPNAERVAVDGIFDPSLLSGAGNCALSGVRVARYRPYYHQAAPYDVLGGVLDVSGSWAFDGHGDNGPRVRFGGDLGLADVLLADGRTGLKALGLGRLKLDGVDVDSSPLNIAVDSVAVQEFEYYDPTAGRPLGSLRAGKIDVLGYAGERREVSVGTVALSGLALLDPERFREFGTLESLQLAKVKVRLDPLAVECDGATLRGAALEDSGAQSRLASLAALQVRGVRLADTGDVRVDEVLVERPEADFVIDSRGIMNLSRVLAPFTGPDPMGGNATDNATGNVNATLSLPSNGALAESEKAPAATTRPDKKPGPAVSVDRVVVADGRVAYRDETMSPAYFTQIASLGAALTGFSTVPGSRAALGLNATIDGHAPLRLVGTVAAMDTALRTDLKLSVRNLQMPALSPYTRKFIAYPLATGKFNGSVKLRIEGKALDAENVFLIEQLTLGEKVESPDAPSLPIQLGLALLSDRDGNIELDIPVQGRLDDPQFRLGKVIFGAIINLFTKIVTAPFAVLGSLFEGGEETGFLEFSPGLATLSPESLKKLDSVAAALEKRPRLRVELAGFLDAEQDRPALAEIFFRRLIERRKLLRGNRKGDGAEEAHMQIGVEEYAQLLTEVYEESEFERPENLLGFLEEQPVEVMERMIREHIEVTDADLMELARQRAAAAQDHLLGVGMVEPERVFLRNVTLDAPQSRGTMAASRVELLLK